MERREEVLLRVGWKCWVWHIAAIPGGLMAAVVGWGQTLGVITVFFFSFVDAIEQLRVVYVVLGRARGWAH